MECKRCGIDIGSTTIKIVFVNEDNTIKYMYKRHGSRIKQTLYQCLEEIHSDPEWHDQGNLCICITGSGGMQLAKYLNLSFEQEVICSLRAIQDTEKDTDVILELGGEDAKITYTGGQVEQRMNGTCAGGTGSFIDQMAGLLNTDASGLNDLAKDYNQIYPIAARCGVFAKTDIQPLLNEGVSKADIAMSIFHAVVVQTISVLACGRPIKGKVAFIGGPLTFLKELTQHFAQCLELQEEDVITSDYGHVMTAYGAALMSKDSESWHMEDLIKAVKDTDIVSESMKTLPCLFGDKEAYNTFLIQHDTGPVEGDITKAQGPCFLGIDAGSTTTKAVLINKEQEILYQFYKNNGGDPIACVKEMLLDMYRLLSKEAYIGYAVVTGYGEALIQSAFNVDCGEVETISHYYGAKHFCKEVDTLLDIGGQDMKCLRIREGRVDEILLNEACSSGCGSFLETFAKGVDLDIHQFVEKALYAPRPVDLGTRCTVFMNSKVKEAQRDQVPIENIAAGLCYSVIKNALYKVIKLRRLQDLGEHIVVQGGTFKNDAVLRCLENLMGKRVIRPRNSEVMGAFGASLLAQERYAHSGKQQSQILGYEEVKGIKHERKSRRCKGCTNNCMLTINTFDESRTFITGNRCDRFIDNAKAKEKLPNMMDYKLKRLFQYYKPLREDKVIRGCIGIPRVLNFYENYPFWFTFFTELGYKVILSDPSTKKLYEEGIATIPSETACYPAKIVHGHIMNLVKKGVKKIFYPCITHEIQEDQKAHNCFNCPVVTSYSENIKNNMEVLEEEEITLINPFLPYNHDSKLIKRLYQELKAEGLLYPDIKRAVKKARKAMKKYTRDIRKKGEEIVAFTKENQLPAICLGGRPYHVDEEINHGIPDLINKLGYAVLTEDSIAHLGHVERPMRIHDQWVYHTRLYNAASYVAKTEHIEFVQLNSFGCGIDAITSEELHQILAREKKAYTVLKIDEVSNLGAVRIRLRSLKAYTLMKQQNSLSHTKERKTPHIYSTAKDQKTHTIIAPQFSPIHFKLFEPIFRGHGFNLTILSNYDHAMDTGLKYVNNDMCYPAMVVIGQIISYLEREKHDLDMENTSVMLAQTGGGCRFTNYIGALRQALDHAGYNQVAIISLTPMPNLDKRLQIKGYTLPMLWQLMISVYYGDLLMFLVYAKRPYEKQEGAVNALLDYWFKYLAEMTLKHYSYGTFKKTCGEIVSSFNALSLKQEKKGRIGLVGELLVKLSPAANNMLVDYLEGEGYEVAMTGLENLFLAAGYNNVYRYHHTRNKFFHYQIARLFIKLNTIFQKSLNDSIRHASGVAPATGIYELADMAKPILQQGNQTGEGWMMAAEIVEMYEQGIKNFIIMCPFGCLPGHVTGRGIMRKMKKLYPDIHIVAIDYDPNASEVNQINRIKLMLSQIKI